MICDYCKKEHPNGVTEEMVAAGHPYLIDAGRGCEERKFNAQPVPRCGARHPSLDGVVCTIAEGHAPGHASWGKEWL